MTITEFLLARIADEERSAESAKGSAAYVTTDSPSGYRSWMQSASGETLFEFDGRRAAAAHRSTLALADHLARWQAPRVLAECEAKRRIVEACAPWDDLQVRRQTRKLAGSTLRHLAAVYADHPDYRGEWRP